MICFGGVESYGAAGGRQRSRSKTLLSSIPAPISPRYGLHDLVNCPVLAFDATTGVLFALSDDRVDSRVFRLRLQDTLARPVAVCREAEPGTPEMVMA